jgi:hypothetical protein
MVAITFSAISAAACGFLIYVLVHFNREYARLTRNSARDFARTEADLRRAVHAIGVAKRSRFAGEGQQAKTEAVQRKEILTSALVGLFGLLAPFLFVMLLNSWSVVKH